MQIYFSGANAAREISAIDLDDGKLAPGSLAQTIVYIVPPGAQAMTPLGPEPLGQVHAEAMENILLGMPLKPANGLYGGLVFVLIVGIGIAFLVARFGLLWAGGFDGRWPLPRRRPSPGSCSSTAAPCSIRSIRRWRWARHSWPALAARSLEIVRTRGTLRRAFAGALPAATLDQIARRPATAEIRRRDPHRHLLWPAACAAMSGWPNPSQTIRSASSA